MRRSLWIPVFLLLVASSHAQNIVSVNQGYTMRVQINNLGVFGRLAYPGGAPPTNSGLLGLEYPVTQKIEHLFAAGVWIGGLLDTSRVGTSAPIRRVSVAFEGWSGPLHEFYPGPGMEDSIWRKVGRNVPHPSPAWNMYWGGLIPQLSRSDQDNYMAYTDTARRVTAHVPLNLKVAQSSYVWNDSTGEGILISEYRIVNQGSKVIDSVYVGMMVEADVGYLRDDSYWNSNSTGYFADGRVGYVQDPFNFGVTPVGVALLDASRPLDSLRISYRWFSGPQTPSSDAAKYQLLSSGFIQQDQYPYISDSRFVVSCGPFRIQPAIHMAPDTLRFAVAIVSGQTPNQLRNRAQQARLLYSTFAP